MSYYAVISSTIYQEEAFIDYRFVVEKAAKELHFTVSRNSETPGETQTAFDRCMENNSPVFLLILGEKLTDNVREECEKALNLGLTILPFIKSCTGGIIPDATKRNMQCISRSLFERECCTFDSCEQLYNAVLNRLQAYLSNGLHKTITCLKSKEDIYPQTAKMICEAKRIVILCQNTSSLLLGYRNDPIEEECYSRMLEWMNLSDERLSFIHIFSDQKTKSELHNPEYIAIDQARKNLERLCSEKKGVHIYLRTSQNLTPCVVADNSFLLSISMGSNSHYINIQRGFMKSGDVTSIVNLLKKEGQAWLSNTSSDFLDKLKSFYED